MLDKYFHLARCYKFYFNSFLFFFCFKQFIMKLILVTIFDMVNSILYESFVKREPYYDNNLFWNNKKKLSFSVTHIPFGLIFLSQSFFNESFKFIDDNIQFSTLSSFELVRVYIPKFIHHLNEFISVLLIPH